MFRRSEVPDEGLLDDPALDFMRLLWSIEHALQRRSKRMEAALGITGPQRLVLRIVGRSPGLSAGELAHVVRLHPSTVTGILQRLVARGLLARKRDSEDSRRTRLFLKARAVPLTRTSAGTIEQAVAQTLRRIGSADVRTAKRVLIAIGDSLDES